MGVATLTRREAEESIDRRRIMSKRWQRDLFGVAVAASFITNHNVIDYGDTTAQIAEFSTKACIIGASLTERLLANYKYTRLLGQ